MDYIFRKRFYFCLSPWRGWSLLQEGGVRLSLGALRARSYKPRAEAWHQGKAPYSSRGLSGFCFPNRHMDLLVPHSFAYFSVSLWWFPSCFLVFSKCFFITLRQKFKMVVWKTRLYDNKRWTETGGSHVWERWKRPKRLIISAFMRVFWQKSCISREYSLNLPT